MGIADTIKKILGLQLRPTTFSLEREYAEDVLEKIKNGGSEAVSRELAVSSASSSREILALSNTTAPAPSYITTSAKGTPKSSSILDTLLHDLIPKTKKEARTLARDWYDTDELFGGLIDTKARFVSSGFRLSVSKLESLVAGEIFDKVSKITEETVFSGDPDFVLNTVKAMAGNAKDAVVVAKINEELLFEFELEHRITSVVKTMAKDYAVYQSTILYWRVSPPAQTVTVNGVKSEKSGITDIAAICPADIDWVNSLGRDLLYVDLPVEIINKIRTVLNTYNNAIKARLIESLINEEGIPIEYIIAVANGDTSILLDRKDGHRWIIATEERKSHGLASPIVSTKMTLPMATRKLLTEGDYSASIMMKHFVTHITSGEEAPTSASNPKATWTSKKMTDALLRLFTSPSKAPVISTDHTVKISFIHPPTEFFSDEKFKGVNIRIFDFTGVSVSIYSGTGSQYSGGFLSIRRLSNDISDIRRTIRFCIEAMFYSEEVRKLLGVPDGYYIKATFSEQGLKEAKQLFEEVKFLVEKHFLGPDQAGELLGHDSGSLRSGVEAATIDDLITGVWGGNYSSFSENGKTSDNDVSGDSAGRPPNDGTSTSEATRNQGPTP